MSDSSVIVRQLPSADAWLAATESLRGKEPILTNLAGSVAESVVAGGATDQP